MSIPEAWIEAAITDVDKYILAQPSPEARARRVILALAEEMPGDAVDAAQQELADRGWLIEDQHLRATIAAFLKHVAGDQT